MPNNTGKYAVPGDEGEILPNKPGFTSKQDIDRAEFSGFFEARYGAIDSLSENTRFDLKYLYSLHQKALGDLYVFAGKLPNAEGLILQKCMPNCCLFIRSGREIAADPPHDRTDLS